MANSDHVEWLKQGVVVWNGRRKLVKFAPDLSGVDFLELLSDQPMPAHLSNFSGFDFSGSNLREAILSGLDFSKANFKNADLSNANLSRGTFHRAKFDGARLEGVTAIDASFKRATFLNAVGSEAVLAQTNVDDALDGLVGFGEDVPNLLWPIHSAPAWGYKSNLRDGSAGADLPFEERVHRKEPTYLVTFATNRKPIRGQEILTFGGERDQQLHYGACQVHVPNSHKVGSLGSPFWKRLFIGDDRLKIRQVFELTENLYWNLVRENFSELFKGTPPTVVIHGYNVGFEDAVLWAAQIGYDLGLMRGISLFTWPSRDAYQSYQADESTVEASKYHLANYLLDFIANAGGRRINVLAHSMGCRCLVSALEIIGSKYPEKLGRIKHLIFAAADVDQDSMRNVGVHIVGNAGLTTSYVCSKDKAVQLSAVIHQFARVGFLPPVFLMDAVDTVEVEKGNLWELGHSYISEAKELLMDIHQILKSSTPANERFSIRQGALGHWVLKD